MTAPMTREELLSRLDERVKVYTSLLGERDWNPKRSHIETARNLMKDAAEVLRGVAQKPSIDPADLWERYLAETENPSPQGAMAFAVEALSNQGASK